MLLVCSIDLSIILFDSMNHVDLCSYNVCDEFCFTQGGRDAKSEPGYKLENGVVGFPLSFRMLRSRGNAVYAFEDVFRKEESHLRWLDETVPLFSFFPNSRNLLFTLGFVHLDLWLEHVISELEIK